MDDLERYIKKRKDRSPDLAKEFEEGYLDFKITMLSRLICRDTPVPQKESVPSLKTE